MNELINVTLNDNHEPVVSGRQLHEALGVKTEYKKWFSRMTEYGFNESDDFLKVTQKCLTSSTGQNTTDHIIKLDMAKEIAMIQRTDKGKEVRQYFIQVEKDFNSPEKIMARALLMADKKIKLLESENESLLIELEEANKNADYLDLILQIKDSLTITQIAQDYGISARKMNQILKQERIQRIVNGQWVLYAKYLAKGYVSSRTFDYTGKDGKVHSNITTVWTQLGRRFLYDRLKAIGILPIIEQ
ncbi:phage antirepressor KilAC domain-containing protein [Streptococcus salivarius]|uniref:phage antirepressor KilAC domain-containing protein n=1 Tax=Streptococcus salivarius TaxID=1304 RepID=UPI001584143C|nr:phage antirepressor KilAC domain-containing protein [Streptococcus salivarius]